MCNYVLVASELPIVLKKKYNPEYSKQSKVLSITPNELLLNILSKKLAYVETTVPSSISGNGTKSY